MEILSVIAAALAAFVLGSLWYMTLADSWMQASGMPRGEDGQPKGGFDLRIFGLSFLLQLVVAGMMRHVFALSGIDSITEGLVAGTGVGLFFISPWIAINNLYAMRPTKLTLIDGGYATVACLVMGLVLVLF